MDDAKFKAFMDKIRGADIESMLKEISLAEIDGLEQKFATGADDNAPLHVLFVCLLRDLPVPKWARDAFVKAYSEGLHGRLKSRSWNEVFGRPPRTKAQMDRFMRDITAPKEIWMAVAEAKDQGEPIDNLSLKRLAASSDYQAPKRRSSMRFGVSK
jgi:hypothetical protein